MTPDDFIIRSIEEYPDERFNDNYAEARASYWVLRAIYTKLCEMEKKIP